MPARFRAILIFEGLETGDRRKINVGALSTRALPLTLMGMDHNPEGGWGHDGADVIGRIDTATREDATAWVDEATGKTWGEIAGGDVFAWVGEGEFDDREEAADIEQLVRDRHLRGISADLAEVTSELEVLEEDEDGWPVDWLDTVTEGNIAAATVCNIPAFRGCTIELLDDDAEAETDEPAEEPEAVAASGEPWLPAFRLVNDGPGCEPCTTDPQTASLTAAGGPVHPPNTWFDDPRLEGPTPFTVTDDGRIFGHLALFGSCHTGYQGQCVTPPKSASNYSAFHTGAIRTAEGDDVACGRITMSGPHAPLSAGARAAAAHYDNTCTAVADVRAGEDEFGIWVAGALRPSLTDEQVRELKASPLSGDWRRQGTGLELLAALAVNTAGFIVPRAQAVAASGVPQSLVAAGAIATRRAVQKQPDVSDDLRELLDELRAERLELVAERHLSRIRRRP